MRIGIYNETNRLTTAVTWGPVGAEAVLAQFYPPHISLFLDDMDVVAARTESLLFADTLAKNNVEIFLARDILSETLKPTSITFNIMLSILFQKAKDIRDEHKTKNHKNYKEVIEHLLKLDIERYGEHRALTLNWKLSLYPYLPMGNLMYARDQMNVLLSKRFRSHMKEIIRRPEVEFYEIVYKKIFGSDTNSVVIPHHETFEGGDAYIHDKTIYVGVGSRTTIGAALFIYEKLAPEIKKLGYTFVLVVDEDTKNRSQKDNMNFMHLDTFSNPIGKNKIALCLSEGKRRKISLVTSIGNSIKITKTGKTFLDYLFEVGQEIVAIPESEQQSFGCNFLTIDQNTVIVPLATNIRTINELKDLGKKIIYANLTESTKGFGAAHCMTGQLHRQNPKIA